MSARTALIAIVALTVVESSIVGAQDAPAPAPQPAQQDPEQAHPPRAARVLCSGRLRHIAGRLRRHGHRRRQQHTHRECKAGQPRESAATETRDRGRNG